MTTTSTVPETKLPCDRCTRPVGKVIPCSFAYDGYGEEVLNACEACRPESHYANCGDCKQLFLTEQLIYHTIDTGRYRPIERALVMNGQKIDSVRDIKVSRLCWVCDGLAKQRNERELAGYKDPPKGDEHHFYNVPWRR